MKISRIDVHQVDLPYAHGVYHLSGGRTFSRFDATVVGITTECGITGWGESTPFGANYIAAHAMGVRAGIAEIAPALIGLDPRYVDRINQAMDDTLVGHAHAKTALDVACWDVFGKATDMSVHELLGGSTGIAMPLISSVHAGTPQDMRARVEAYRQAGYKGHSIKIGATQQEGGPSLDAQRILSSMHDYCAGEFFIVDANGGLSVDYVKRLLRLLPKGLDFVLEAPVGSLLEHQALRSYTDVPVFIDELSNSDHSVAHIIRNDLADGIGLKISKSGGLTQGRKQRDLCLAAGLAMSVQDTVGSEIAFAAIVHLAQTIPPRSLRCILDTRDMVAVSTAEFDCLKVPGGVIAPDLPGLGIRPNLNVLGSPVASYH